MTKTPNELRLNILTDSFKGDPRPSCAAILRQVADAIESGRSWGAPLFDGNGDSNQIGRFDLQSDEMPDHLKRENWAD